LEGVRLGSLELGLVDLEGAGDMGQNVWARRLFLARVVAHGALRPSESGRSLHLRKILTLQKSPKTLAKIAH
jgi:hypothetical protein